ncbi:bifunctional 2-polyprenyl-6-hydroxyphenol methylase/3-demethylubiquinol 3-O-methyltransferase UbiG [Caulobacter sp. UNC279MFTsu5.1]|uniref:class I SAM-dependent methyltransferase n=1 Tax=Caulobacter sp. UNC279MFTsu5.1 TaxID=1502775 RepID=UPI000B10B4C1|nr:methyltransferase domain-containing protein [Caulobacter sp. UNC279MFTsu5.1]
MAVPVFPPEFSPEFLRRLYPDLAGFNDEQMREHYQRHGRAEGRTSSPGALREDLLGLIDPTCEILEIGPSWSPAFKGPNVRYLDILTTEGLKARAREHGVDEALCPSIHYSQGLTAVDRQFEMVFSSHNLEHQPDLIRHLQEVAEILRPGGVYVMLVPDKRFCFDHFLPESTIAEVLEAFLERRTRHAPRHVLEHLALTAHNETGGHWAELHGESPFNDPAGRLQLALDMMERENDRYIDVHAWKFTPDVFRRIFAVLEAMNLMSLETWRVYDTPKNRNEFGVVLRKA